MPDAKSLCRTALLALVASTVLLVVGAGVIHAGATPAEKCAAAKNKAAVKKIGAKAKCWQKAFLSGAATADSGCLSAAEMKFSTAISKAEAKGGCAVTGDANTIESAADTCVSSIVALTPTIPCGGSLCNGQCLCGCPVGDDCTTCAGAGYVCPSGTTCENVPDFGATQCVVPPAQCTAAVAAAAPPPACGGGSPSGCCYCGVTVEGGPVCVPPGSSACPGAPACPGGQDECTASSQCPTGSVCGHAINCTFNVCAPTCTN
jgi:hypothetical protein